MIRRRCLRRAAEKQSRDEDTEGERILPIIRRSRQTPVDQCLSVEAPLSHLDRCADSNMVTLLLNPPKRGQVHRVRVLVPPRANRPRHGLIVCRARDRFHKRDA